MDMFNLPFMLLALTAGRVKITTKTEEFWNLNLVIDSNERKNKTRTLKLSWKWVLWLTKIMPAALLLREKHAQKFIQWYKICFSRKVNIYYFQSNPSLS